MVMEIIVRGGKKYKALKKLLEVVSEEPEKEFLWIELVRIMVPTGISYPYTDKIISELKYLGVLKKVGERYRVDVEKLKEILKSFR
jgi:tRNA G26 N,N-dimethylase Trm1